MLSNDHGILQSEHQKHSTFVRSRSGGNGDGFALAAKEESDSVRRISAGPRYDYLRHALRWNALCKYSSAPNCCIYLPNFAVSNRVEISLPSWLHEYHESFADTEFTSDEQMMEIAIEISARNVANNTGGPFGCAIFERCKTTGICKLFTVGANRVTALNNSTLHGEMVAIQFAQLKLATFSMRKAGESTMKEYIMCTSCEPCAMCLGGTLWSGVHQMICSATKSDAEAIGFIEGPVFEDSYTQLVASGVAVKRNILREKGAKVLQQYGETGVIYNS